MRIQNDSAAYREGSEWVEKLVHGFLPQAICVLPLLHHLEMRCSESAGKSQAELGGMTSG